jgi:hypothetical protein
MLKVQILVCEESRKLSIFPSKSYTAVTLYRSTVFAFPSNYILRPDYILIRTTISSFWLIIVLPAIPVRLRFLSSSSVLGTRLS